MTVLYRPLWFIEEHFRVFIMVTVPLVVVGSLGVAWWFSLSGETYKDHLMRLHMGLRTTQELITQGHYCQAMDALTGLAGSDDPTVAQDVAAWRPYVFIGCQLSRDLHTGDALGDFSSLEQLQTAQQVLQRLREQSAPYPPLVQAILDKQRQIAVHIATVHQSHLHTKLWDHLQYRQWAAAEALLPQLPEATRLQAAALIERSRRHSTWLEQGTLAQQDLRLEEARETLQRIAQEDTSPFTTAAATALTHIQTKLEEEHKAFGAQQLPYKRTKTTVKLWRGPSPMFGHYVTVSPATVVVVLGEVHKPRERHSWARVRLVVPHRPQTPLIGFIRQDMLMAYP